MKRRLRIPTGMLLTASHKFHGKLGTGTIFMAIDSIDGPTIEGQLVRPLTPASRVVGFGSWFENITGNLRSVLFRALPVRRLDPRSTILEGIERLEGATARIRNDQGCSHILSVNEYQLMYLQQCSTN